MAQIKAGSCSRTKTETELPINTSFQAIIIKGLTYNRNRKEFKKIQSKLKWDKEEVVVKNTIKAALGLARRYPRNGCAKLKEAALVALYGFKISGPFWLAPTPKISACELALDKCNLF